MVVAHTPNWRPGVGSAQTWEHQAASRGRETHRLARLLLLLHAGGVRGHLGAHERLLVARAEVVENADSGRLATPKGEAAACQRFCAPANARVAGARVHHAMWRAGAP
jgi:hypothetical protein